VIGRLVAFFVALVVAVGPEGSRRDVDVCARFVETA